MILAGLSAIVLVLIYSAVMQREFQDTDNKVGKGFAVLGIYLFVVTYCECRLPISFLSGLWFLVEKTWNKSANLPGVSCRRHVEQHDLALRG